MWLVRLVSTTAPTGTQRFTLCSKRDTCRGLFVEYDSGMLIGYARCASSMGDDEQGQRAALVALGVDADSIHIDHGLTGTDRPRPALTAALSALSARDTLVVTTLERLARSVSDLS